MYLRNTERKKNSMTISNEKSMKNSGHVFVYGTLKKGGYYSHGFNKERVSVTPAKMVGGTMYNLGGFPGLVLGGNDIVNGELHLYKEFSKVVRRLDRIEGFRKQNYECNLYNKHVVEVETQDGRTVKAMVYTINTHRINLKGCEKVENGTWLIEKKGGMW